MRGDCPLVSVTTPSPGFVRGRVKSVGVPRRFSRPYAGPLPNAAGRCGPIAPADYCLGASPCRLRKIRRCRLAFAREAACAWGGLSEPATFSEESVEEQALGGGGHAVRIPLRNGHCCVRMGQSPEVLRGTAGPVRQLDMSVCGPDRKPEPSVQGRLVQCRRSNQDHPFVRRTCKADLNQGVMGFEVFEIGNEDIGARYALKSGAVCRILVLVGRA